jgi:mono/diheme cytochrome c family protein
LTLFAAVIFRAEFRNSANRWNSFLIGDPHEGSLLFFEKKGCAGCHSVNGVGGKSAPDLGFHRASQSSLSQIVSAMWNHTPAMWESMREKHITQPYLDREDMANLFAFLYTARYMDEPGDIRRGEHLFAAKGCIRCHGAEGVAARLGPDLATVRDVDTPLRWAQIMWNHAPKMEARMRQVGVTWPRFEAREMNDLLAYIRETSGGTRSETDLLPASPRRGARLFKEKDCVKCHSVNGEGGRIGPDLAKQHLTGSIVQLAGVMWNHAPEMWHVSETQRVPRPEFSGRELADLAAFLARFRYFESEGSRETGEVIFRDRGCAGCHGTRGEGTHQAPTLRAAGRSVTLVTLATALWSDGPRMYRRFRELGQPWPTLKESEVGDIVAFLNSPSSAGR